MYEENLLDLDIIPMDDEEVYKMFGEGDTIGIFQFESDGMRKCLRGLKPDNIEDLIAMSALYRPGPIKFIDSFINRKHGKEKVEYPHKYVEDILRTTYGIAVYQEQVMLLAQKLAGYTLGEADLLRRAIGKKDIAAMEIHRETFIKRARKKDIPKRIAEDVYAIIAKFAEYGFNKPHSTAYAILAYKTAYVKKHFPKQFIAANLTSSAKKPIEVQKFINECKRLSIRIFSPDVNYSEEKFAVHDDGIRFGLCSIKNSGAMDSLGVSRASLILSLESLVNWKHELTRAKIANLQSLFGENSDSVFRPTIVEVNEWKQSELLKYEKLALGVYLSGHPLDDYSIDVEAFTSGKIGEVKNIHHEREVRLAGLLSSFTVKPTKNFQQMGIGVLQDQTGELKVLFFSSIFDKCQLFIGEEAILWIEGSLKFDPDKTPVLMAESVKPMENIRGELAKQLHIKLNENNSDELLRYILKIIINNPGKAEVHLHIDSNGKTYKAVSTEHLCNPVNRLIREIENKIGRGNVWLA
jgi:DNA polymerase-3 subunit alpha